MDTCKKLLLLLTFACTSGLKLKEVFSWNTLDFVFPTPATREEAVVSKSFIPMNNVPSQLAVWKNTLFLAVPRTTDGVPYTLSYVDITDFCEHNARASPLLIPYPSFEANIPSLQGDEQITSVYGITVDDCDLLWAVDTGIISGSITAPPQILIFNLHTHTLFKKFRFPRNLFSSQSLFANIVVDSPKGKCADSFAYIPDMVDSLVVYDLKRDTAWKIKHNFFNIDPFHSHFFIGGNEFEWRYGVYGIALTASKDGTRTAYFNAVSSCTQFKVDTGVLHDESQAKKASYNEYKEVGNKGPNSQTTASVIDVKTNIMYYTQISKNEIYCWDTNKPFSLDNLEALKFDSKSLDVHEDGSLVYPSDIKLDEKGNLWILHTSVPVFPSDHLSHSVDVEKVNFKIYSTSVRDVKNGPKCWSTAASISSATFSSILGIFIIFL